MTVTFVPNPDWEREVQRSEDLQHSVTTAAEEVAAKAKELAPVLTGALRDSIRVEHPLDASPQAEAQVVAGVPYSAYVEFGTTDTPMHPFLRPAADAVVGRGP